MPRKTKITHKTVDTRHKDVEWKLPAVIEGDGSELDMAFVQVALLLDLRDELKFANRLLAIIAGQPEGVKK